MKFTCQKNELVQAIQLVSKAIANKPQTPILSGIYFETKDNQVELHATDNEMGIIATIPSEIEQENRPLRALHAGSHSPSARGNRHDLSGIR